MIGFRARANFTITFYCQVMVLGLVIINGAGMLTCLSKSTSTVFTSVVRVFAHGAMGPQIDPSWWSNFSFQPVLHDWCNKGRGMCYPVCGMVHIKEPLLLIDKSSLCGGSGFPFSLSEWSYTTCLTPYNCK